MRMRPLGNTGLEVSELALGAVELGMDYGFRGSARYARPQRRDAVRLLREAVERGVNLIDTAAAYGESESIIGEAFAETPARPYIATKIALPEQGSAAERREEVARAIQRSLRALRLEALDVLQIHNATPAVLGDEDALRALEDARRGGKVRFIGASVYGEKAALLALRHPWLRTLEVAFNVLDQQMSARVFPAAARRRSGVLARSAFLRGVLTEQVSSLPVDLDPLRRAALCALEIAGEPAQRLAALALRFCLSTAGISSVIVGVRSVDELRANLAAADERPLDGSVMARLGECALDGEPLLTPLNWKGLI